LRGPVHRRLLRRRAGTACADVVGLPDFVDDTRTVALKKNGRKKPAAPPWRATRPVEIEMDSASRDGIRTYPCRR
jgi:hypothetical protein